MEVCVLGPTRLLRGGVPVDLGVRKQRALLAALALHRGRPVPYDTVVDLLWGEAPPPGVLATLHTYVAGLRRAVEPEREPRAPSSIVPTVGSAYALKVGSGALDAQRFSDVIESEHRRLSPTGIAFAPPTNLDAEALTASVDALDEVLGLWTGTPYTDLADSSVVMSERARLDGLRVVALEDRAIAGLALGRHGTVAADLEALTGEHPLRERLWALRAIALTRAGRQAEALEVLREVSELLDEELGIQLGAGLRDLQIAILQQDPSLIWIPRQVAPRPAMRMPLGVGAGWPVRGRDRELDALEQLLSIPTPTFAVLTGEPGIGKTRLTAEVAERARVDGATVVIGRCSQDDGAPPLWPWTQVLGSLGHDLPMADTRNSDEGAAFRAWEQMVDLVIDSSRRRRLVIVLDDLHWADVSSLRVLRLLCETAYDGQLTVVSTWRKYPEPSGAFAEVAEMLARRHALRLDLEGLDVEDGASIVETIAQQALDARQADLLRARTDGNPFFLVEYARLAAVAGDLDELLDEDSPPSVVHDVLSRRIEVLPAQTRSALQSAAVVGRQFGGGWWPPPSRSTQTSSSMCSSRQCRQDWSKRCRSTVTSSRTLLYETQSWHHCRRRGEHGCTCASPQCSTARSAATPRPRGTGSRPDPVMQHARGGPPSAQLTRRAHCTRTTSARSS